MLSYFERTSRRQTTDNTLNYADQRPKGYILTERLEGISTHNQHNKRTRQEQHVRQLRWTNEWKRNPRRRISEWKQLFVGPSWWSRESFFMFEQKSWKVSDLISIKLVYSWHLSLRNQSILGFSFVSASHDHSCHDLTYSTQKSLNQNRLTRKNTCSCYAVLFFQWLQIKRVESESVGEKERIFVKSKEGRRIKEMIRFSSWSSTWHDMLWPPN